MFTVYLLQECPRLPSDQPEQYRGSDAALRSGKASTGTRRDTLQGQRSADLTSEVTDQPVQTYALVLALLCQVFFIVH